jgi:hypothetical protein
MVTALTSILSIDIGPPELDFIDEFGMSISGGMAHFGKNIIVDLRLIRERPTKPRNRTAG